LWVSQWDISSGPRSAARNALAVPKAAIAARMEIPAVAVEAAATVDSICDTIPLRISGSEIRKNLAPGSFIRILLDRAGIICYFSRTMNPSIHWRIS